MSMQLLKQKKGKCRAGSIQCTAQLSEATERNESAIKGLMASVCLL